MIVENNNDDLQDNDIFLTIYSVSSAFQRFWDEYKEKINKRIVIDLKNPPKSGEEGVISRIHGTENFRVRIQISSDIDRNAYRLAHEIYHGLIFIQMYPQCEIPRFLLTNLKSKKERDDLLNMCKGLNTLIYDPLVNRHLEGYGFNLHEIYLKSSKKEVKIKLKIFNEYQKANLGFLYSLMKIEIAKYCPSELNKSTYLLWFEKNCRKILNDCLENILIVQNCDYNNPDEVKNSILSILERYRLTGKISPQHILFIQPKEQPVY